MSFWFKPLFTLALTHEYYGGACPDFEILVPDPTRRLARNGRLLIKQVANTAYCIFEADAGGGPVKPLDGETLRLGLRLHNPNFNNFTESPSGEGTALYRNRTAAGQLDTPLGVKLAGAVIRHAISKGTRPVTLALEDATGAVLQTQEVGTAKVTSHSFETGPVAGRGPLLPGAYTVRETYPATTGEAHYYVDPELLAAGAYGVVEIRLEAGFYAAPLSFGIAFTARKQKLSYYVVASKYGDADFAKLDVSDQGFGEDQRGEVKFTRMASNDFAADDLNPALIGANGDKVALFRSNAAQPRLVRARSKIQLKRNNEVLIQHLPAPTEHQAQADLIIHVAKP